VQDTWPALIPLLQTGRLRPERHITHRLSLTDGAEAYRLFDARENGVLKTVLHP
jgi:threonine dehydrogenase-like Zn-dependent dehydrogenase